MYFEILTVVLLRRPNYIRLWQPSAVIRRSNALLEGFRR